MKSDVIEFKCLSAVDLLQGLGANQNESGINNADMAAAVPVILAFLETEGAEIVELQDEAPGPGFDVVFPGQSHQVRMNKILFESSSDFVLLSVALASTQVKNDSVLMGLVGAALASFVKVVLRNVQKLDAYTGERCVIKALMLSSKEIELRRPIEQSEVLEQIKTQECSWGQCRYRSYDDCSLTKRETEKLLEHMEKNGVLKKVGTSAYALVR